MDPEKHTRYLSSYQPNDYFWGLGIENETYLQFSKTFSHPTSGIHVNHRPERYSVNYYVGLEPDYKLHLKELFPISETYYKIPIFMNAHTLQKTDISGNHETTYEKVPQPNTKYKGQSIHEVLTNYNPHYFENKYKKNYMYDGDTIEFMTQNYYKCTIDDAIEELLAEKKNYLTHINEAFKTLNIFTEYGTLSYPTCNEPFVSYLTNSKNIAIFNNGTYHINITLPTQLGSDSQPLDPDHFVKKHKNLIRFIQFLEPFIIVKYGTPDPFSKVSPKYSRASQRCAVSRYIGIGTYDTDTMQSGKILNVPIEEFKQSKSDYWWYTNYTTTSNYIPLPKIGVDINFRKHGVHGIELRFLDWFPESKLKGFLTTLVHLCDYSLAREELENPIHNKVWNNFVVRALQQGKELELEEDEYNLYKKLFYLETTERNILDIYESIETILLQMDGECTRNMLNKKQI